MDYVNAFWVGGAICALVQILLDKTKLLPGRVMVLLVCSGAVLGAVGIYEPFTKFAGAGATVPLLGFGNTLWKGMKTAIDESGFLGLFTGGFTACAAPKSPYLIPHPIFRKAHFPGLIRRITVRYHTRRFLLFPESVLIFHPPARS